MDGLIREAIAGRRLVSFTLKGLPRLGEPHDYGIMGGVLRLFFYQVGGQSSHQPAVGWRWGDLAQMEDLTVLAEGFAGPRAVPSGRHVRWDTLIATVSPRPVSEPPPGRR